jgi:hypothetical protein
MLYWTAFVTTIIENLLRLVIVMIELMVFFCSDNPVTREADLYLDGARKESTATVGSMPGNERRERYRKCCGNQPNGRDNGAWRRGLKPISIPLPQQTRDILLGLIERGVNYREDKLGFSLHSLAEDRPNVFFFFSLDDLN